MAQSYKQFVLFYPICAGVGMVLYGVFCGATRTAPVRNMMLIAWLPFTCSSIFWCSIWAMQPCGWLF